MNCAVNSPTPGIIPIMTPKPEAAAAIRLNPRISPNPLSNDPLTGWGCGVLSLSAMSMKACEIAKRPSTTTIRSTPPASQV